MAKLLTGTRIYGTGTVDTQLFVNGTDQSTSTTTGALEVVGGVGIGGNLYVGGISVLPGVQATNIVASGSLGVTGTSTLGVLNAGSATFSGTLGVTGTSVFAGLTSVTNTTSATSTTTGALQVTGGVGIGGALYVQRTSYINNAEIVTTATIGNFGVTSITAGTDTVVNTSTGAVVIWNTGTLQSVTNRGAITTNQLNLNNGVTFGSTANVPVELAGTYTNSRGSFIRANGTIVSTTTTTALYALDFQHLLAPVSTTTISAYFGNLILPTLSNTATYTNMYGTFARIDMAATASSGTVGSWIGFTSENPTRNAAANVRFTNHIGFRAEDPSAITATNVYGVQSQIVSGTNRYNIYASGTADNYFNGNVGVGGLPTVKLDVTGAVKISGITTVTNTSSATSTTTGALIVSGGVGIGQDLRVGGTIYGIFNGSITGTATTATNLAGGTAGQVPYQTGPGATSFYGPGTAGNVLVSNGTSAPSYNNTLTLTGTTEATSTATGALQIRGGASIGRDLVVGNKITGLLKSGELLSVGDTADGVDKYISIKSLFGTMQIGRNTNTNAYIDSGMAVGTFDLKHTSVAMIQLTNADEVILPRTTAAVSTSTGALEVAGGVGIGRSLFVQESIVQVGGTYSTLAATYNLINTTATTVNFAGSATALTIGATSGSTTVRNNLSVTGNLTVQGTTTIVDSTVTNIADPIITLGGGTGNTAPIADDNKDRGIAFKWVNNGGTTSTGFFGYDDSTGFLTYIQTATITNEVVSGTKGAVDANLAGGTAMSLIYQSAANTTAFLAAGTSGFILQTNGTGSAPSWVNASGVSAGSATNADAIRTIASTASTVHYLTFVDSNNATNAYESLYTTSSVSINPQSSTLTAGNLRTPALSIALGSVAGGGGQGTGAIAIGWDATAGGTQNGDSIAIGHSAARSGLGQSAIAIGYNAGYVGLGTNTVALGSYAGYNATVSNAIFLNGTGSDLSGTNSGLYIAPIRADATTSATTWAVYYNATTKELTTATAASGSSTGTTSTFVINNSTAATSTSTGALQVVNGGAGIGGNIYAGGDIFTRGTKVIPLNIQEFTATANQTTFTISGGYTVGTVQVFANGINLGSADIVASNGTTVVVLEPRAVGDIIRVVSGGTSSSANNIQNFSIAMSIAMSM